ncbi:MAG: hypothetical protein QOF69_735 [Solirubrobacteraceae bacterium]|jgi:signal-transduction protein with cAMP-binding, CBS, and nucleotidyltransferase domain|nr:hypothetical protein [Solirubrobacteraceae bacterium]MEA2181550.1 hypothetical protein [Solirubrobacteraceae bacterium]
MSSSATSAPSFAQVRVADVMHGPLITCGPATAIQIVAQTMADERVD